MPHITRGCASLPPASFRLFCAACTLLFSAVSFAHAQSPILEAQVLSEHVYYSQISLRLQFTNIGTGPAVGISVESISARAAAGSPVLQALALPVPLGELPPGGSTIATATFSLPANLPQFSLGEAGTFRDRSGAVHTFSLSQPINVGTRVLTITPFLTFNNISVGMQSVPQPVTINNIGTDPVNVGAISFSGPNSTDFSIVQSSCPVNPVTLAPGAMCSVAIAFKPSAAGPKNAVLSIGTDAAGSPQRVALSGSGEISGKVIRVPASLDGSGQILVACGPEPVKISNIIITGRNAADFRIFSFGNLGFVPFTCTSSFPVTIEFSGSAGDSGGPRSAVLQIFDDASGSPQSVLLTGILQPFSSSTTPASPLSASPGVLTFENVFVPARDMGMATLTIENAQPFDTGSIVTIPSVTIVGPQAANFRVVRDGCSTQSYIAPQATCTVGLTFTPTGTGPFAAAVEVQTVGYLPLYVILQGSGIGGSSKPSLTVTPAAVTYGTLNAGTSATQAIVVENLGNQTVKLGKATIVGPQAANFSVAANSCGSAPIGLPPGSSCTFNVKFSPAGAVISTAMLQIASSTGVLLASTTLEGTTNDNTSPILSLSSNALTFYGTVKSSNPDQGTLTITNKGTAPLLFSAFQVTGANASEFQVDQGCPVSGSGLAPFGATCYLTVSFHPKAAGLKTATLSILDNAPGSPQMVTLAGEAVFPSSERLLELTASGPSYKSTSYHGEVNFGPLPLGQASPVSSAAGSLGIILNEPESHVSISKISVIGPDAADFITSYITCSEQQQSAAGFPQCLLPISFKPSATGLRTATVEVRDNALGSPHVMDLAGYANAAGSIASITSDGAFLPDDFGLLKVGTSSSPTYYSVQLDPGAKITSAEMVGPNAADFVLTACTSSSCGSPYSVQFTPGAAGSRIAALQITYTGGVGRMVGIPLTGFGEEAAGILALENSDTSNGEPTTGQAIVFPISGISLYNVGGGPVTISNATVGGLNASDFKVPTLGNCSTIAPDGYCFLDVQFTPSLPGVRIGLLQLNSDALNSPQVVTLMGVDGQAGSAPYLQASTSTLDFGVQAVNGGVSTLYLAESEIGSPVSFGSVQITGPDAQDFSLTYNSCSSAELAGASNCSIAVQFAPSALGSRSASLTITSSGSSSPQTIELAGVGQPRSFSVSLSSSKLDFGPVNVHSWTTRQLSIGNTGDTPLTVGTVSVAGANFRDFSVVANSCQLPVQPSMSCDITVAFRPRAEGIRNAALQISTNILWSPLTVTLTGTSQLISKYVSVSTQTLNFDSPGLGQKVVKHLTLFNTGGGAVTVSSASVSGAGAVRSADFTVTSNACHIVRPGSSCLIAVTFAPSAAATLIATLTVASDAVNSPVTISLVGQTGTAAPVLTPSTTGLDFGVISLGTSSAPQTVSVAGAVSLPSIVFNAPVITGPNARDFTVTDDCSGSQSAANFFCAAIVTFTPSIVGLETATLNIGNNVSAVPLTIALAGTGEVASRTLTTYPNPLLFSNTNPDHNGLWPYQALAVFNSGTLPVHFRSFTVTGTDANLVQLPFGYIDPNVYIGVNGVSCGASLDPGQTCYVPVVFTLPNGKTNKSASLVISDDAAGTPVTVPLIVSLH